jgi:hypothetical protein
VTFAGAITITNGNNYVWTGTNSIVVAEGEVGELVCAQSGYVFATVIKNSIEIIAPVGTTVTGPATFRIQVAMDAPSPNPDVMPKGLMTVKLTPLTYSPQKSVTVAPGMGNVQIEMESSTNLLTWATATNGVYSDDLRFFRVKLTKLNP